MVRRLKLSNLSIVLDFYHAAKMQENPADLADYMPWVSHLHISTDEPAGKRGFLKNDDLAGLTDLLKIVYGAGYDGALSVEPSLALMNSRNAKENLIIFHKANASAAWGADPYIPLNLT